VGSGSLEFLESSDPTRSPLSPVIWVVTFKLDNEVDEFVHLLNFWIQALLVKLVPCCGLTVLSALLVRALRIAEERRQMLRGREGRDDRRARANARTTRSYVRVMRGYVGTTRDYVRTTRSYVRTTHSNARTTRMLLLVVVLFLVTEFPQGVTNLLNGILTGFVDEIYASLGDLLDILALINNGINFLLYCTMSKQFRDTFIQLFVADKCCRRPSAMSALNSTAGGVVRDVTIPLGKMDTAITVTAATTAKGRLRPTETSLDVVCTTVQPRSATSIH